MDCFHLGDLLRSLDIVPTQEAVLKAGGTKKVGEKKLALEEFLPIFSQIRKEKDQGAFEDFSECMKVYDKMENGTMLEAELAHILMSLGEKLNDRECDEIMHDCVVGQPDEDGNIKYDRELWPVPLSSKIQHVDSPSFTNRCLPFLAFIKKLMSGPFPEEAEAKK